jgi:hypothetical protein
LRDFRYRACFTEELDELASLDRPYANRSRFRPPSTELAKQSGKLNWRYEAADSSLRSGDQVVNLGNLYLEYARAPRNARAGFRDKYRAILATRDAKDRPGRRALVRRADASLSPPEITLRARRYRHPSTWQKPDAATRRETIPAEYRHRLRLRSRSHGYPSPSIRPRRVGRDPRCSAGPRRRQSTRAPSAPLGTGRPLGLVPRITRQLCRVLPPVPKSLRAPSRQRHPPRHTS